MIKTILGSVGIFVTSAAMDEVTTTTIAFLVIVSVYLMVSGVLSLVS